MYHFEGEVYSKKLTMWREKWRLLVILQKLVMHMISGRLGLETAKISRGRLNCPAFFIEHRDFV